MNGGQMWILEKVISLEEDLENWTMAQNLHSWMIGRLQEGAPGSSTQIGSGVYKAPLQGFPYYWRRDELNTPMYREVISLVVFSNFEPQAIPTFHWISSAPKSDSKSPAFWMVKAMHGASNRVTLQRITDPSRWQRGPRVFPSEIFSWSLLWKLTWLTLSDMTKGGPLVVKGFQPVWRRWSTWTRGSRF